MKSKKLLFVVTEDYYFVSHRLALGVAALKEGYDVVVATRVKNHGKIISNAGIKLMPIELSRRGGNPLIEIWNLYKLYQIEEPDIIHHVALKPVIYGSIASLFIRERATINAISGLGWMFTTTNWLMRALLPFIQWIIVFLLNQKNVVTILQNSEDSILLERAGLSEAQIRLIPGAGVDTKLFYPSEKPPAVPAVMLVSRMLRDKGIGEFIEAAQIISNKGIKARFILVGGTDYVNPSCISETTLLNWHGMWGVEYWGHRDDMEIVWQSADIACLPSYREGMPKALLEAAATGLPIVTTDVPGCQEVIVDGDEGLLVPPKDAISLANALMSLIVQPQKCRIMGAKARKRAEKIFSQDKINNTTLKIYEELLSPEITSEKI